MKTKLETITPDKAKQYLASNTINRPLRDAVVDFYALDMKKGQWVTNHQGIAFNDDGKLIDGQHRLAAVVKSGSTIQLLVSRGLPDSQDSNGHMCVMDSVDRGVTRKVGDQLFLRHGYHNGRQVAACCTSIIGICTNTSHSFRITTSMALEVLAEYGKEIVHVTRNRSNTPGVRSACVMGAVAFAMGAEENKIKEFYTLITTGEGIHKTGPTSPAFRLRNYLLSNPHVSGFRNRIIAVSMVLNAARHFVSGEQLTMMKTTSLGMDYFISRQKSRIRKILAIVGQ